MMTEKEVNETLNQAKDFRRSCLICVKESPEALNIYKLEKREFTIEELVNKVQYVNEGDLAKSEFERIHKLFPAPERGTMIVLPEAETIKRKEEEKKLNAIYAIFTYIKVKHIREDKFIIERIYKIHNTKPFGK